MLRRWPTSLGVHRRAVRSWRELSTTADGSITQSQRSRRASVKSVNAGAVLAALRAFHQRHGHCAVPPAFVVPHRSDGEAQVNADVLAVWPSELQGLKLGNLLKRIYRVLEQPQFAAIREELLANGLAVDAEDSTEYKEVYWRATVLAALTTYADTYGDLYVPRSFVVPEGDDSWPVPTWGLRLGQQVHTLRKKAADDDEEDVRIPLYQREALEAIDFVWDVMEHRWTTKFLPSLQRYHKLHGHSNVPQKFVVPSAESSTVKELSNWSDLPLCHGYRLGSAVNKLRRGDAFAMQVVRYFDELQELGFTFSSFDRNWSEKVLPGLETFYRLHGHCHVGAYFVVPVGDKRWPLETWGTGLGFIVQNIRSRGDFFPQIMRDGDRLEAIGFVWNRAEAKWRQMVLPSLETFVSLYKHSRVPASFVVPREYPWPEDAYDLRLGRIVSMPSARQRFANYIEIDRKRLERIGFTHWSYMDDHQEEDAHYHDSDSEGDESDGSDSDSDEGDSR